MSVFTTVTPEQLSVWLKNYSIGTLTRLEGIAAGIDNTNYFVTTTLGRYVLTLFEEIQPRALPFYLNLMAHLDRHGIPCPKPIANLDDDYLGELNGKPASIVTFVPGTDLKQVNAEHCATIGRLLAKMHLAGASYRAEMPNPRGPKWWKAALPRVLPFLDQDTAALLREEVRFQSLHHFEELPRGVIHADLFRDNVLWDAGRVGGIIDFYFSCNDALVYDVAITVNDWCVASDALLDRERTVALLGEYHKTRPFTAAEYNAWPVMLRAGALRFWLSRLHDLHLPRHGEFTDAKDPRQFQRILEQRVANETQLGRLCQTL